MARLDGDDQAKLTPIQLKLWDMLSDGKPHSVKELIRAVSDDCDLAMLRYHMSLLRTKIRAGGKETVVAEDGSYRRVQYVGEIG